MINYTEELFDKYREAVITAGMGLWEYDSASGNLNWDEGFRVLYSYNEGEYSCLATDFLERVVEEDREVLASSYKFAIQNGTLIDIKFRVQTQSNELRYIRSRGYQIRDDNQFIKLVGLHWNVTVESLLQIELTKSNEFTEMILNALPDPLFVKNEKHEVIYANTEYEKLVGHKREVFIGKDDYEFFPKEVADICWEKDEEVFRNNVINENEEIVTDIQGRVLNIHTKKTPIIMSATEKLLVGVIRDITDVKRMQTSLIEQSKMASLGEMAADIAHEINNPLMIIQGKSQLLLDKINKGTINIVNCKKDLEQIEKNCDRISKIVKSLKSVSRKADVDPLEEISILRMVDEAFEISKERFRKKKLNLFVITDDFIDYSHKVMGRSSEIVQVLVNLLNNSYDAIQNQSRGWTRINLTLPSDSFTIEVTDSGTEIDPEVAQKMMDPFFTTKEAGKGTGLGLSISKQIILNHSGELYYDSSSANTRFVVTLPKL